MAERMKTLVARWELLHIKNITISDNYFLSISITFKTENSMKTDLDLDSYWDDLVIVQSQSSFHKNRVSDEGFQVFKRYTNITTNYKQLYQYSKSKRNCSKIWENKYVLHNIRREWKGHILFV